MSDTPTPPFYTSIGAWPVYVQKYARALCWERQREAQGGIIGGSWTHGTDANVIEWMLRSRNGNRAMASAQELWPAFCESAKTWYDVERAKAQRTEER